jgi:hypothetical protein
MAIAACAPAATPSSTSGVASSADAPRSSSTVAAPRITGEPAARPFGVPSNAEPLVFGCEGGMPRCTDLAPGTYYTAGTWAFMPGLAFTLPVGWSSLANEAGELELHATADGTNDIMIWRDVVPWVDDRAAIALASDPEAWVAWLQSDPRLVVSEPERVVIGSRIDATLTNSGRNDLQAIAVTVGVAPEAANEEPDCPGAACVQILIDERHWGEPFSIARDQMDEVGCPCTAAFRFYFASIGYASHPHLLVVALTAFGPNADREADMARLQAAAQPILDSLIVPPLIVDN